MFKLVNCSIHFCNHNIIFVSKMFSNLINYTYINFKIINTFKKSIELVYLLCRKLVQVVCSVHTMGHKIQQERSWLNLKLRYQSLWQLRSKLVFCSNLQVIPQTANVAKRKLHVNNNIINKLLSSYLDFSFDEV